MLLPIYLIWVLQAMSILHFLLKVSDTLPYTTTSKFWMLSATELEEQGIDQLILNRLAR